MELKKFNPWNWVRHEERSSGGGKPLSIWQSADQEGFLNPVVQLHRDMERLFDEAFRGFGLTSMRESPFRLEKEDVLKPNVDIAADNKAYTITVEVPGIKENEVELDLANDALIIRGTKKREKEEQDKEYYRVERSYGQFERVLSLPEDAMQENINASFDNGILTVTIPRKALPKAEVKHIDIKKAS